MTTHDPLFGARCRKHRRAARKRGPALVRLLVALAIMLVAVLPHATLAASARHHAQPQLARSASAHHGHADSGRALASGATERCHDATDNRQNHGPAKPSCCVLGCGLLASGPIVEAVATLRRWSIARPLLDQRGKDRAIEPSERPPRRSAVS